MPSVAKYKYSGDPYIDGLLGGEKWGTLNLTYSYPSSSAFYGNGYGNNEPNRNFESLSINQQTVVDATLTMYAAVSNLTFRNVNESATEHGDLRYAMSDAPSTAWAYFPSVSSEGGDVWFNNSSGWYDNPVKGNYAFATFLHESGHALGLEHPHTGNIMPTDRDSLEYTVMSYRSYVGKSLNSGYTNETWGYPQSLMMYDIAALQYMYGANYNTLSGNTTYSWSPTTGEMFIDGVGQGAPGGNRIFLTVWDGGGTDTYDLSNYSTDLTISLRPGDWTTTSSAQLARLHYDGSELAAGNIANALMFNGDSRSLIENAIGGSGNDVIYGSFIDNEISGLAGDDEISGGYGRDILYGDAGNDTLWGGPGIDWLFGGDGSDRLFGALDDDRLFGNAGNDVLFGGPGNDWLYGGSDGDRLYGEDGNDILVSGRGPDILNGGEGADTFVFTAFYESRPGSISVIEDFVSGVDTIDLQMIDANARASGDQAFDYIGNASFSNTPGELNFANEILSGDIDGDGVADFQVHLVGVSSLFASDFIL